MSSRSACHLSQITLHSISLHWGLTNSPLTHGRQARSETKTERPHMPLQWAPKSHSMLGWSSKVGPAPACKETQGKSMPTVGWKLTQVTDGRACYMDQRAHLLHEETSNRLETAMEAQHHIVHHTMAVYPTPRAKILGRPASLFDQSDQIKLVVTPTDIARRNIGRLIKRDQEAGWPKGGRPAWHFHATCSSFT